ncbi:MAG: hypothetical protein U0T85_07890 [Cloacibacterium normanense]
MYQKVSPKNHQNQKKPRIINIDEFIAVKGIKAIGNQFIKEKVKSINITIPRTFGRRNY